MDLATITMTLLQLTPATETPSPAELSLKLKGLLAHSGGKKQFSEKFISEMEAYLSRNIVVNDKDADLEESHCLACLKAHALALAEKYSLSPEALKVLKAINADIGHLQYYRDGEEIRRVLMLVKIRGL